MQQVYLNQLPQNNLSLDTNWCLYGDSVFTSARIIDGSILWKNDHIGRLVKSVNDYFFSNKLNVNDLKKLEQRISSNLKLIKTIKSGYVRITFFPNEVLGLGQQPSSLSSLDCLCHVVEKEFLINIKNCTLLDIGNLCYPDYLKHGSYAIQNYWKRKISDKFDDYIRVSNNKILESSTGNIFLYLEDKTFVTPKIFDGILSGICRKNIIQFLKSNGENVIEKDISLEDLENAKSAFFTNAVQMIVPIANIDRYTFETSLPLMLNKQLLKKRYRYE